MDRKIDLVEVSKRTRKIDKDYLSAIDDAYAYIKQKKKEWVNRVSNEPKLLDAYDCLRLSVNILENYKYIVANASTKDNPKVIDYALPTLKIVEASLKLVAEIDSGIEHKDFDINRYKIRSKNYSMQLQETGKIYLTDFEEAIQKIPQKIINKAVNILNEEIGQEF